MSKRNGGIKIFFLVAGDALFLYAALFSALFLRYRGNAEPGLMESHRVPFTAIFFLWICMFGASGLYDLRFMKNSKLFIFLLVRAMAVNMLIAISVLYLIPFFAIEPRRNLLIISGVAALLIFVWRYLFNLYIIRAPTVKVLFFGTNPETIELADFLAKNRQLGYQPVAFMSADGETTENILSLPVLAPNQSLAPIVQEFSVDMIVISREIKENKTLVSALFQVIPLGAAVVEFPSFYEMNTGKIPLSLIGEVWFLENLIGIRKNFYEFAKRALDIILSALGIIPSLFLFPFIAAAIKINSRGPIFFTQERVGRNGRPFRVIKYRSMVKSAEKLGGVKGNGSDTRHTKVGIFLRKNYLDELPQIINILKGEMSFIGPRPERPEFAGGLSEKISFYQMRLLVPPGITGWAQIHMEDDASVEDAPEKMQFDLYYIKNRSLTLDLLIALKTIFTLLKRRGR